MAAVAAALTPFAHIEAVKVEHCPPLVVYGCQHSAELGLLCTEAGAVQATEFRRTLAQKWPGSGCPSFIHAGGAVKDDRVPPLGKTSLGQCY